MAKKSNNFFEELKSLKCYGERGCYDFLDSNGDIKYSLEKTGNTRRCVNHTNGLFNSISLGTVLSYLY